MPTRPRSTEPSSEMETDGVPSLMMGVGPRVPSETRLDIFACGGATVEVFRGKDQLGIAVDSQ